MQKIMPFREAAPALVGAGAGRVAAPVAPGQRLTALDMLRGFALLGILVLNIETFAGPSALHDVPLGTARPAFVGWHAELDLAILAVKWAFFEGKMRTLFALLFGAGIVLASRRFEARHGPGDARRLFLRRTLWLLALGLVHGVLIWAGDILTNYALCALLLYPFRKRAARTLLAAGLAIGLIGGTIGMARIAGIPDLIAAQQQARQGEAAIAAGRAPTPAELDAMAAAAAAEHAPPAASAASVAAGRRDYLEGLRRQVAGFFGWQAAVFGTGLILEVLGTMLIGMALVQTGFLTGAWPARRLAAVAALGYAVALPITLAGIAFSARSGFAVGTVSLAMYLPYTLQVYAGSAANTAALLLLWRSGWLHGGAEAVAKVGRMALTNHIATSLVCQWLFAWGPLKLYGALAYHQMLYVVAAVWALTLAWSSLWLRIFAYGPLEGLWRAATYGRRPAAGG